MANVQNLKPSEYKFTQEDAKKGQVASAKKRAERKKFNELFNHYLDKQITDEQLREQLKQFGFEDKELTNKNAMVFAQFKEALKGSTQAFVAVRDTMRRKTSRTNTKYKSTNYSYRKTEKRWLILMI